MVERDDVPATDFPTGDRPSALPPTIAAGRYRIIDEIGRGGQGAVFLAEDTTLKRKVAIKILSSWATASRRAIERFRRETLLTSKLDHPSICPVYDAGEEGGVPFIVMRHVGGRTLSRLIHGADAADRRRLESPAERATWDARRAVAAGVPIPESPLAPGAPTRAEQERLLLLFEKVARALHVAHEAGIVHRDVKPANIMVNDDGEPIVLDFGLARDDSNDVNSQTLTGEFYGTPSYMSPEQIRMGSAVDRRTDVYSLGVSLYEALTRKRPFEGPTRHVIFESVLNQDPPSPRVFAPGTRAGPRSRDPHRDGEGSRPPLSHRARARRRDRARAA